MKYTQRDCKRNFKWPSNLHAKMTIYIGTREPFNIKFTILRGGSFEITLTFLKPQDILLNE